MKKILFIGVAVILLGAGCNVNLADNYSQIPATDISQDTTQKVSITPRNCKSDKLCLEEILRLCQPGTYNAVKNQTFTINGPLVDGCSLTLTEKKGDIEKSMTCPVPSTITTEKELASYLIENVLSETSACSGSLREYGVNTVAEIEKNYIEKERAKIDQMSTTGKPLITAADRDKEREANIDAIIKALNLFYINKGTYPDGNNVILGSATAACLNASGWQPKGCAGPFMTTVPNDPLSDHHYYYTMDKNDKTISNGRFSIEMEFEGTFGNQIKKARVDTDGTVYPKQ